ncbi:MAG: hypothetical protein AEth_01729 [Candidatus Argoarchaeum ethanivorans]|uniref:Uncharacterized protein n=1 Tax=Candidatus Argoarchaeum ethanivorans TaxID=2608793 RepID=A0A8B3S0N0_9EURY|nr:MAG: hypothetical protein AEth_01729 [Candidatus Argoarchaeum ethanivorans]
MLVQLTKEMESVSSFDWRVKMGKSKYSKEYMEDAWNPAVIHYTQDHALSEAVTLHGVEPFHLNVHLPTKLINIDVAGQKLSSLLTNQE